MKNMTLGLTALFIKQSKLSLILLFLLTPAISTTSTASLITNGSFELASINPGGSFLPVFPGETSITGWDVISEDVHYMGTFWQASDGIRSIDLDGLIGSAGGVSQSFATVAGTQYEVTFDMSGNYFNAPTIKPMSVSADGQSEDFFFDTTGITTDNMGWTSMNWLFTADDTMATLEFQSLTTFQGWGPVLDNVAVTEATVGDDDDDDSTPVPEPSIIALFAAGLFGLGFARRRMRS